MCKNDKLRNKNENYKPIKIKFYIIIKNGA